MGRKEKRKAGEVTATENSGGTSLFAVGAPIDPALASLFSASTSAAPNVNSEEARRQKRRRVDQENGSASNPENLANGRASVFPGVALEAEIAHVLEGAENGDSGDVDQSSSTLPRKKRRQKDKEADLEGLYLQKLAREEEREEQKRRESKDAAEATDSVDQAPPIESAAEEVDTDEEVTGEEAVEQEDEAVEAEGSDTESFEIPQHETLAQTGPPSEVEKSSRTVFLANVSIEAITSKTAEKALRQHLSSFLAALPKHEPAHKIESLRFRSTAYDNKLPKKAAFVKKELMEATAKSTNAYVVYNTQIAAREAARKLNGTVVLDRHLRVDQVAHPAKVDHRRCVFVGNLDFVDDDTAIREGNEHIDEKTRQKKKEPGDVEEGLWRQFGKAGTVESVRVVRDSKTRVGKGFAYVQFVDENGVEAALLFNDKKFPPMLPRKLRVVRAKAVKRKDQKARAQQRQESSGATYRPKLSSQEVSFQGRAGKLLGKAGAAQMQKSGVKGNPTAIKPPESFVFEGHRAKASQGTKGLKLGGKNKSKGKPTTRSSKRGAAWKKAGGKKGEK